MTLAVRVKSPYPDLVIAGVAPEELLVTVLVGVEREVDEPVPVDVAEVVAVC